MSKGKQKLWLFFMLFIYVAIALVGFVIAYIIKIEFFQSKTYTSQKLAQESKTSLIPTGWKMYSNSTYQLQFSYPPTDTVQSKSYGFGVSSVTLQNKNGNSDFQILLLPKTLASAVGQNFDSYYSMPNNTTKTIKNPVSQDNTTEQFTKIKNITVNGNKAVDYQSTGTKVKPGTQPEIGTFIEAGSNLVLISTNEGYKAVLKNILNSFIFQ